MRVGVDDVVAGYGVAREVRRPTTANDAAAFLALAEKEHHVASVNTAISYAGGPFPPDDAVALRGEYGLTEVDPVPLVGVPGQQEGLRP